MREFYCYFGRGGFDFVWSCYHRNFTEVISLTCRNYVDVIDSPVFPCPQGSREFQVRHIDPGKHD